MRTKCIMFDEALRNRVKKFKQILRENYSKSTKIAITAFKNLPGEHVPKPLQNFSCFAISFQFILLKKIRLKNVEIMLPPPFEISRYATAGVRLIAIEEVRNCRKFYTLITFFKMAGGRLHSLPLILMLPPWIRPSALTISYRNHQKSLEYRSHLAPLVLFFFIKRQSQKRRGGGTMSFFYIYAPA